MKQNSKEQLLEFSKRLKTSMSELHMTATELANATGIGKSDISYYLRAKYMPKQERIYKMASVLKVNPAWLGAFDTELERRKDSINELIGSQRNYHEALNAFISTENWDVDKAFADKKENPIYLMARGMSRLNSENQQKLLNVAKTLFGDDFTEEGDKK